MVSLVLLTVSVALGVTELVRFASPRWPRFVVAALHRNVSLLAMAFLCVHVVTAVADTFAPIHIVDVFIPFVSSYRPIWLGLGTVAFDLLLALVITSLLRERIGYRAWRAVHWAAYASWPIALVHGLGTGSDTRVRWAVIVNVACLVAVLAAVLARVGWTQTAEAGRRAMAALGSLVIAVGVVAWMVLEPMRPGWARKAGTPNALLAASNPAAGSSTALGASSGSTGSAAAQIPIPFSSATSGSMTRTSSDATGSSRLTISTVLPAIHDARLRVVIEGTPLADGGVAMTSSNVRLGVTGEPNLYRGTVVNLDGTTVLASLRAADGATVSVSMHFSLDDTSNLVTGTVSASAANGVR